MALIQSFCCASCICCNGSGLGPCLTVGLICHSVVRGSFQENIRKACFPAAIKAIPFPHGAAEPTPLSSDVYGGNTSPPSDPVPAAGCWHGLRFFWAAVKVKTSHIPDLSVPQLARLLVSACCGQPSSTPSQQLDLT